MSEKQETFDEKTERFRRETRIWPPGRDMPSALGGLDAYDVQRKAWEYWCKADAQLAAAQAVIGKLRKTTDGVHMIPGEAYWVIACGSYSDEPSRIVKAVWWDRGQENGCAFEFLSMEPDCPWEEFEVDGVYSTQEAAQASQNKQETLN